MACVLVTHEIRFAKDISDGVFFTEGGVIVEHGAPSAIFESPGNERTRLFLRCARGDDRQATRKRARQRRRRSLINLK
jgi:polar amino acid transport system ATP-binding protein